MRPRRRPSAYAAAGEQRFTRFGGCAAALVGVGLRCAVWRVTRSCGMETNGHKPIEYKAGSEFSGVVGRTTEESTPAWPQVLRAREGAPNVLMVVLDDT